MVRTRSFLMFSFFPCTIPSVFANTFSRIFFFKTLNFSLSYNSNFIFIASKRPAKMINIHPLPHSFINSTSIMCLNMVILSPFKQLRRKFCLRITYIRDYVIACIRNIKHVKRSFFAWMRMNRPNFKQNKT